MRGQRKKDVFCVGVPLWRVNVSFSDGACSCHVVIFQEGPCACIMSLSSCPTALGRPSKRHSVSPRGNNVLKLCMKSEVNHMISTININCSLKLLLVWFPQFMLLTLCVMSSLPNLSFFIVIILLQQSHSETKTCAGSSRCSCSLSEPCTLQCYGKDSCKDAKLKGKPGYPLSVICDSNGEDNACEDAVIDANSATDFTLYCDDTQSCQKTHVICGTEQCNIICSNYGNGKSCYEMRLDCGSSRCGIECQAGSFTDICDSVSIETSSATQSFECTDPGSTNTECSSIDRQLAPFTITTSSPTAPSLFPTVIPTPSPSATPSSIPTITRYPTTSKVGNIPTLPPVSVSVTDMPSVNTPTSVVSNSSNPITPSVASPTMMKSHTLFPTVAPSQSVIYEVIGEYDGSISNGNNNTDSPSNSKASTDFMDSLSLSMLTSGYWLYITIAVAVICFCFILGIDIAIHSVFTRFILMVYCCRCVITQYVYGVAVALDLAPNERRKIKCIHQHILLNDLENVLGLKHLRCTMTEMTRNSFFQFLRECHPKDHRNRVPINHRVHCHPLRAVWKCRN